MTYLSRMLARAGIVDGPDFAAALPRLPSRFEAAAAHTGEAAAPDGATAAVAAPGANATPPTTAPSAQPDARPAAPAGLEPRAADGRSGGRGPAADAVPLPAAAPAAAATPAAPARSARRHHEAAAVPEPRPAAAAPVDAEPADSPARVPAEQRPPQAAVPAVAVAPAIPDPPARTGHPPAGQQQSAPGSPDVVQVSIGRIEVRASIARTAGSAPPPAGAAGPAAAGAGVLSLTDYLRGKREPR